MTTQTTENLEITITIPVKKYRTDRGNPTCARSFPQREVCPFLETVPFSPHGRCGLIDSLSTGINVYTVIWPGNEGFLDPHSNCPLWGNQE